MQARRSRNSFGVRENAARRSRSADRSCPYHPCAQGSTDISSSGPPCGPLLVIFSSTIAQERLQTKRYEIWLSCAAQQDRKLFTIAAARGQAAQYLDFSNVFG